MTLLSFAKHAFYLDLIDFTVRAISALVVFLLHNLCCIKLGLQTAHISVITWVGLDSKCDRIHLSAIEMAL